MYRAMASATTGMQAQELRIEVISNNLANVNTNGFKKARADFQDLLYEEIRSPGAVEQGDQLAPAGLEVGHGTRVAATSRYHTMGDLRQTSGTLDIAIEGDGFFQVRDANGEVAYTRDGALKTDAQGQLVTSNGLLVEPPVALPPDAAAVTIARDGTVSIRRAGETDEVNVGQLSLANFVNPAGLRALGRNLFAETPASGQPLIANPGQQGTGSLLQGFLESSNVEVVTEMMDLITTQRAYETSSKVIQAADEMLRTTANMR
ncbi:MAG: flagellar basal-body rod protein FlgG [Myxococcota bacterium]